ncbi:ABC transporter substrate-binding protein [Paenibacillus lignilyticus]|uniref:Extracellular solute-binding protein n=1 Tax=Paenibacillus lignilyticus TaxID=1172615 RepID=A0ABS5C991_9BACL|nr:extracellular solute-binding protein [Paenibacillus lignilyticus]MBP3962556.1 extracellular solute-binding protein [Paenibacillus lignilyticus]
MKKAIIGLAVVTSLTALTGCGNSNSDTNNGAGTEQAGNAATNDSNEKFTIRLADGSPGDEVLKVWNKVKEMYEKQHPNVTVEFVLQDPQLYQTMGLPSLLNGENAPDIYFEWAGDRLKTRVNDGFAADVTEALESEGFKGKFGEGNFVGMVYDGKKYMIPTDSQVTNVIWYNKRIFNDLSIQPPKTWDEFMAACAKIKAANIIPITTGNKDLWTAGNWNAHLISRVVGEQAYVDAMELKSPFNTPDFVKAMSYAKQIWDNQYINDSVNGINDDEGAALFFNEKAAMYPIGAWFVSGAQDHAPDMEYDYFNIPAIPDGKGDQGSVIGVQQGYVINKNSKHIQAAIDYMKLYESPEVVTMLSKAGSSMIAPGSEPETNPINLKLKDMMNNTKTVVSPPDTGYNLEVADALNSATAEVLGGVSTPEEALAKLDAKIAPLKK